MTIDCANSALLIVAHGSTVNRDSSAPTLAHAAEREKIDRASARRNEGQRHRRGQKASD